MPSIVGLAPTRLGEMAASASALLFSNVVVTASMPARAISSGTRPGCGAGTGASPTS